MSEIIYLIMSNQFDVIRHMLMFEDDRDGHMFLSIFYGVFFLNFYVCGSDKLPKEENGCNCSKEIRTSRKERK